MEKTINIKKAYPEDTQSVAFESVGSDVRHYSFHRGKIFPA